ncbi:Protein-L-isoaspartate(D-aspartate) O-methyltransferase family-containing protein [Strongyloides ratti]|uniref:Protein-L-isoaspartate(D-aspartate) O-methyltransferase family-containing protein n=1 Tax=Strongyloides ratti TaxID=34506 RepID=A0A090L6L6_STRRB|nr:Protein-L-isoaspartate(D-aspartate) O-methyltransferase family-containing protein [Strongyloides ratti]CEF65387.1 Protein-L-isoaspartate(D-aspartate) O-methyltransferase family-containing protein [Strongyloides ratti]
MGGSGSTPIDNDHLVDELIFEASIKSKRNELAFRLVDRKRFFPQSGKNNAYLLQAWKASDDDAIRIHLSAPGVYAMALEALNIKKGLSFLNIGSGTGYFSTVVGFLLGSNGINHGIECRENITEYAREKGSETLLSKETSLFDWCRPVFVTGNAFDIDENCVNRYDRIYVGAKVPEGKKLFFPKLLKINGICVMPFRNGLFRVVKKSEKCYEFKFIARVSFADLFPSNSEDSQPLILPDMKLPTLATAAVIVIRKRLREKTSKKVKVKMILKTLDKEENKPRRVRSLMREEMRREENERIQRINRIRMQRAQQTTNDQGGQNQQGLNPPVQREPIAPNENVVINLDDNGVPIDDPFEIRDEDRRGDQFDFLEIFGDVDFNIRFRSPTPDPRPGQGGTAQTQGGGNNSNNEENNSTSTNSSTPFSEYSDDDRTQSHSELYDSEEKMDDDSSTNKDDENKKEVKKNKNLGTFSDYDDEDNDDDSHNNRPSRGGGRIRVEATMALDFEPDESRVRVFRDIATQERQSIEERIRQRERFYENRDREREANGLPNRRQGVNNQIFANFLAPEPFLNRMRDMGQTINDLQRHAMYHVDHMLRDNLLNRVNRSINSRSSSSSNNNQQSVSRPPQIIASRQGIDIGEYVRRARDQRRLRRCLYSFDQRIGFHRYGGWNGPNNHIDDGFFADAEDVSSSDQQTLPNNNIGNMRRYRRTIPSTRSGNTTGSIDRVEGSINPSLIFESGEGFESQRPVSIPYQPRFSPTSFPSSIMVDELDQEYGTQVVSIHDGPDQTQITVERRELTMSSDDDVETDDDNQSSYEDDNNSSVNEPDAKKSKNDENCPCSCECHSGKEQQISEEVKGEHILQSEDVLSDDTNDANEIKSDDNKLNLRKRKRDTIRQVIIKEADKKKINKGRIIVINPNDENPSCRPFAPDENEEKQEEDPGPSTSTRLSSSESQQSSTRPGPSSNESFNERVELARMRMRVRVAAGTQTSPSRDNVRRGVDAQTNTEFSPNRVSYEPGYLDFERNFFSSRGWDPIPLTDPIRDTIVRGPNQTLNLVPRYIPPPESNRHGINGHGSRSYLRRRIHAVDEEMNRRLQQMQRTLRGPFTATRRVGILGDIEDDPRELSNEESERVNQTREQREDITDFSVKYKGLIEGMNLCSTMVNELLYL